jgi:hypothetical protein
MSEDPKVSGARIEVERSKAALLDTANQLLERFQPHNLVDDLWESAKNKGADLAEDAVDAVAKRPVAIGGVVAALAMFLARDPLKKATVKFYDAMTPLFEPRSKAVALKEKRASRPARAPAKKAPAKRTAQKGQASPRRPVTRKTEKA